MQNIFKTHSVRDRVLRQQMFRKFLRRQIAKKDPQYTVDVVGGGGWLAPVNPQNRYAFETNGDSSFKPQVFW